jgi:hypothetical protein
MDVIIENVRSFFGRHTVPLRDFTILVGENSTGKSTFLAVLAAMGYRERFPERPAFNEPPFNLGNYETIASRQPEKRRSEESFSIGFSRNTRIGPTTAVATYRGRGGQVELARFESSSPRGRLVLQRHQDHMAGEATLLSTGGEHEPVMLRFGGPVRQQDIDRGMASIFFLLASAEIASGSPPEGKEASQYFQNVINLWVEATYPVSSVVPLAPIRSKPNRTYEQLDTPFRPEGDHIPLRLARILRRGARQRERRTTLSATLDSFGQDAGLFSHVEIRKLSPSPSAPFEIIVTVGGQRINIADVGYGVSQVLPVVAESVLAGEGTLLLQQPEVHLHPRAQAALGTFLARLSKETKIVCETHSDYLIDRVCQEVALGSIAPDSVLILYFERRDSQTTIYPIEVDELGNLVNAPPSYRSFFIQEELQFLSRGAR